MGIRSERKETGTVCYEMVGRLNVEKGGFRKVLLMNGFPFLVLKVFLPPLISKCKSESQHIPHQEPFLFLGLEF